MEDLAAVSRSSPEDRSLAERSTHDLLNPVSAILGLGETIRSRGSSLGDDTIRSFGESIVRQAERLESALRDLERASFLLREDPSVALADVLVEDVLSPLASDRVRIESAPGLRLHADRELLSNALGRLVENALAFSGGDVVVRARAGWIEVADRGTGFTQESLANAFEPLAPGTNARNERGRGLGFGLYIARRLLEAQGGTLTAVSSPGEGSVFRIELPG